MGMFFIPCLPSSYRETRLRCFSRDLLFSQSRQEREEQEQRFSTTTRGSTTTTRWPSFPPCMPSTAFAGEFPGSWAFTIKVKSNILIHLHLSCSKRLIIREKGAIMLGTYLKVTDIPVRATMHHHRLLHWLAGRRC